MPRVRARGPRCWTRRDRKAWLSAFAGEAWREPRSAAPQSPGVRLGRGALAAPMGLGTGRWPRRGWLAAAGGSAREGEEAGSAPSPAGIPPRRQRCSVLAQPGSSAGREDTRGEYEPHFPRPVARSSPCPCSPPKVGPPKACPICGSPPGINPDLAPNLPNSDYFS